MSGAGGGAGCCHGKTHIPQYILPSGRGEGEGGGGHGEGSGSGVSSGGSGGSTVEAAGR